jgi:hypothetical protein
MISAKFTASIILTRWLKMPSGKMPYPGGCRLRVTQQHVKFFVQLSGVAKRIGNAVAVPVKIYALVELRPMSRK